MPIYSARPSGASRNIPDIPPPDFDATRWPLIARHIFGVLPSVETDHRSDTTPRLEGERAA